MWLMFGFAFDALHPGCLCGGFLKAVVAGVYQLAQIDAAVVGVDDFCSGIERMDSFAQLSGLKSGHFADFVDDYGVAEFNLLDNETLKIFFAEVVALQG